jgi:hypothetical protein
MIPGYGNHVRITENIARRKSLCGYYCQAHQINVILPFVFLRSRCSNLESILQRRMRDILPYELDQVASRAVISIPGEV